METPPSPPTQSPLPLVRQSLVECEAMARYALSSGLKVSSSLLQRLKTLETALNKNASDPDGKLMRSLAECHRQLALVVAPATPRTIMLLDGRGKKSGLFSFLGPVPLTRHMMITALLSLVLLICITLSPDVNSSNTNADILLNSGLPLLMNELFLLSAAALGASFSALFIANRYIQEGTFDPKYNISYWIRFVLGLIAGFILATLIDVHAFKAAGADTVSSADPFARPLLAMLGGFSASVVYRILSRIADSVEAVFRGDPREQVKTQTDSERTKLMAEAEQDRSRLAYRLMALQRKMSSGKSGPALQKELDTLLRELIDPDAMEDAGEAEAAPAGNQ